MLARACSAASAEAGLCSALWQRAWGPLLDSSSHRLSSMHVCSSSGWQAALQHPPATAAAAAATPLGPLLHLRRRVATTAAAWRSKTEDFDLIAPDQGLARIEGLDDTGFIVKDVQVEGSIMLAGDVFTLWRVHRMADITLDSLALLRLLKPVPDLLVLGCGRRVQQVPPDLARQLHLMGVRVDALDTANAVATFNVLNQEGRKVVGALLPQGTED
ncbi:hypothetical protein ABPG75_002731 [Micractinium tetrahymenae]